MEVDTIIKKGKKLLYFMQPNSKPITLICVEQKGKGKDLVKCREIGKSKERLFTVEKLEFMTEDNYKLAASPDGAEKYEGKHCISFKYNEQELCFTFEFEGYTNEDNQLDINQNSFTISKIEIVGEFEGYPVKLDRTDILLELVPNEHWIEMLDKQIKSCFTGTTYNLYFE